MSEPTVTLQEYQRVCDQRAALIGAIESYGATLREALTQDAYILAQRQQMISLVNVLEDAKEASIKLGYRKVKEVEELQRLQALDEMRADLSRLCKGVTGDHLALTVNRNLAERLWHKLEHYK